MRQYVRFGLDSLLERLARATNAADWRLKVKRENETTQNNETTRMRKGQRGSGFPVGL
jgi:hypothetical protein